MIQKRIFHPELSPEQKKQLRLHSRLKLQIELVPAACQYENVRSNLKKSQWDKIRRQIYAKANFHCEICGKQGTLHPVECHEVWVYNEKAAIQKLKGFRAVCPLCHEVIHFGRAGVMGNRERALMRFVKMNRLKPAQAEEMIEAVWQQWYVRNCIQWSLDLSTLPSTILKFPNKIIHHSHCPQ